MHHSWDVEGFLLAMDRSFEDFNIETITRGELENSIVLLCNIRDRECEDSSNEPPEPLMVRWIEREQLLTFNRHLDSCLPCEAWGWLLYRLNRHHMTEHGSVVRASVIEMEPDEQEDTLWLECNWSIKLETPVSAELERGIRHSFELFYLETCILADSIIEDWERAACA